MATHVRFTAIQITAPDECLDGPLVIELRAEDGCLHSAIEVAPGYRLVADEQGVRAVSLAEALGSGQR